MGSDVQTELNNFVFVAVILACLFMAVVAGFPFMVVSEAVCVYVCVC